MRDRAGLTRSLVFLGGTAIVERARHVAVVYAEADGRVRWQTALEVWPRPGDYFASLGTRIEGVDREGRGEVTTEAEHSRGASLHFRTRWRLALESGAILSREPLEGG